jgi:hypothetical protein
MLLTLNLEKQFKTIESNKAERKKTIAIVEKALGITE